MTQANQRTGTGTVVLGQTPRAGGGTLVHDPSSLSATVASDGLDATLSAPSSVATTMSSPSSGLWRSTVLPRLDAGDGALALVPSDRPRYEKRGLLGQGGVGEVVKTIDNDIERTVAVKRLKPDMRSPGHLVRFVDEIRTIGSMEHPNIVPIHDVGVDEDGQYFFVMKYVEGETLEAIIEKLAAGDALTHARYGFERRVEIFLGVLEAIAYAHARGVIHRDIKPANIMVGPWGEVTVMDWGLARKLADRSPEVPDETAEAPASGSRALFRTRAGTLLGTPAYMSPEQARSETLDVRSDVYALSVMFHELLCLTHYLHDVTSLEAMLLGVQQRKVTAPSFVSSPHQSRAPMDLAHYVNKGVAKDPNERYQSVDEMIDRLRRRAAGDIPIECHITFLKRVTSVWSRFVDRHPFFMTAVMAVSVLGTLGGGGWAIVHALK